MTQIAPNPIDDAAQDLSRLLTNAERDADQSLVSIAKLIAGTAQARMTTPVDPSAGQAAIMRLSRSMSRIVEATSDVLRAHGELGTIYRESAGPDSHPYTQAAVVAKGAAAPTAKPVPATLA